MQERDKNMDEKYNLYDILDYIAYISEQSVQGNIKWECKEYSAPHFHNHKPNEFDDTFFEEPIEYRGISLGHGGTFVIQSADKVYEFSMFVSLAIEQNNSRETYLELKIYNSDDDLIAGHDIAIEEGEPDEYGVVPLCDAVFLNAAQWFNPSMFDYQDDEHILFLYDDDIASSMKDTPLAKLTRRLVDERRVVDFHKVITNPVFRDKLLKEFE